MDPIQAAAAIAGVTALCLRCAKGLKEIREPYDVGALSISALSARTTLISTSLSQLQVTLLGMAGAVTSEVLPALDTVVTGCYVTFACLAQELRSLSKSLENETLGLDLDTRVRLSWDQETMDEMLRHISQLQTALDAIGQIVKEETLPLVSHMLQDNKTTFYRVGGLTETLRDNHANVDAPASILAVSVLDSDQRSIRSSSAKGRETFAFDSQLLTSRVYQQNLQPLQLRNRASERLIERPVDGQGNCAMLDNSRTTEDGVIPHKSNETSQAKNLTSYPEVTTTSKLSETQPASHNPRSQNRIKNSRGQEEEEAAHVHTDSSTLGQPEHAIFTFSLKRTKGLMRDFGENEKIFSLGSFELYFDSEVQGWSDDTLVLIGTHKTKVILAADMEAGFIHAFGLDASRGKPCIEFLDDWNADEIRISMQEVYEMGHVQFERILPLQLHRIRTKIEDSHNFPRHMIRPYEWSKSSIFYYESMKERLSRLCPDFALELSKKSLYQVTKKKALVLDSLEQAHFQCVVEVVDKALGIFFIWNGTLYAFGKSKNNHYLFLELYILDTKERSWKLHQCTSETPLPFHLRHSFLEVEATNGLLILSPKPREEIPAMFYVLDLASRQWHDIPMEALGLYPYPHASLFSWRHHFLLVTSFEFEDVITGPEIDFEVHMLDTNLLRDFLGISSRTST